MIAPHVARLVARLHDDDAPLVCGVVNVTPDSFSDGGRYLNTHAAVEHSLLLVEEGADLLDVGGESTRPGSTRPSGQEELDRVLQVVEALVSRVDVPVSVDTSRAEVMRACADAGAAMVNDVRGLEGPGALDVASGAGVVVCVSHMQGEPATMQDAPAYDDVVAEVGVYLASRVDACLAAGIPRSQVVIDPGFGFGKALEHNLRLLAELHRVTGMGQPVMAGLSRKSMLGTITGRPVGERVAASIAAAMVAAHAGTRVLRVHDVASTRDALRVLHAVTTTRRGTRTPAGAVGWS